MPFVSIPGHYDGQQVQLDEAIELPANTRLIITVLGDLAPGNEVEDCYRLSETALAAAYGEDEVEYTEADLRK